MSGTGAYDWPALREAYRRDGVVKLAAALDAAQLGETLAAYEWSLAHPGPGASKDRHTPDVTFYNDLFNPQALSGYRDMLQELKRTNRMLQTLIYAGVGFAAGLLLVQVLIHVRSGL